MVNNYHEVVIFSPPELEQADHRALAEVEQLQEQLATVVRAPRRWLGTLRRLTLARAIQGSNSIEGYNASLDDVAAAAEGEATLDADAETEQALAGYRDAMTYVLQLSRDEEVRIDESLMRALHFMMMRHQLDKNPGRWRPGAIWVKRDLDGQPVYEGPPAELVPSLIDELVDSVAAPGSPVIVRAAMAHLNLVMIHPFSDGNGRMARCLQTLVLAREKIVAPVFSSIEEYLGANTNPYYRILAEVGAGRWRPERDSLPWVRFCITGHYRQARTLLRRVEEAETLWDACTLLVAGEGLPLRSVGPMTDAARGLRIRNSSYRAVVEASEGETISEQTASRDLKALVDTGALIAVGEKRARFYRAGRPLSDIWESVRASRLPREADDPYADSFQSYPATQQQRLELSYPAERPVST
jgi:Fic family protein